ncbi:hypothetical protein EVAR_44784_1 [Eumeta japonica]|uniref:Uncharacterized protein n=1 Tax=Eumeta variegata TaxID=151549 RepID=A0A4C1Y694_EUMVA|nr:hypothetical protein EVAR_44784_1 [Eumeta japonica]
MSVGDVGVYYVYQTIWDFQEIEFMNEACVPYPIKGSYVEKDRYSLFLGFEALRDIFDKSKGLLGTGVAFTRRLAASRREEGSCSGPILCCGIYVHVMQGFVLGSQ